jgi:two-component system chemotaxis sensor kinase CheA
MVVLKKYLEVFLIECRQHLESMSQALIVLEKSPESADSLRQCLVSLHTLKGIAGTAKWDEMESLAHALEDVFDGIKNKKCVLADSVDILFQGFDMLGASLEAIGRGDKELVTKPLVERLENLAAGGKQAKRLSSAEHKQTQGIERIKIVPVKVERLDLLMNLAEELLTTRLRLDQIKESLDNPELTATVENLGRLVSEVQFNVMQSRMVPIGSVFNLFNRMVRDLSKQNGKQVNLEMEGSDIELDRTVVDEIGESLVHLIRNALDHGIETPEERKKSGKPPQGTIRLMASRSKELALVEVKDDGAGLNLEEIKKSGVARGVLSPNATKEEVAESIFAGVSTTRQVTKISGRGIGLDIVKKKIESLGGSVKVTSELKHGTTFTLEIPLTLAIIRTLFVQVGGQKYAVPAAAIERLVTVNRQEIKGMLEYEAIVLEGEEIPLTRLGDLLDSPKASEESQPIVVIKRGEEKFGLIVDALLSTQEIVIKPLNRLIRQNNYFAGSSIIGSGEVVLILDIANLVITKSLMTTADLV